MSDKTKLYSLSLDWRSPIMKDLLMFDVPNFIKRNLESLAQTDIVIPQDKLGLHNNGRFSKIFISSDIIILEGTQSQSVQPGMVTIGRYNLFSSPGLNSRPASDYRHLIQLVNWLTNVLENSQFQMSKNRISTPESNQLWINDLFSFFLFNETREAN